MKQSKTTTGINETESKIVLPGRNKRRAFRIIKGIIIAYCSIGIALYYLQEKFLFHPTPLPFDHAWKIDSPFQELNIAYNKNVNLNIIRFQTTQKAPKGAVIYFHGNMQNIERYAPFAKLFTEKGYEVWMPDYPGYGKTTGELTEKILYDQAFQVYKMVNGKFSKDSIIIYGKSLGTGLATYLGSIVPASKLILETPYYSIPDIFYSFAPIYPAGRMSTFKIPSGEYLSECTMPVTIFHGTDDEVIPLRSANKLKPFLKAGDNFITIQKAKHNNIAIQEEYINAMNALLK